MSLLSYAFVRTTKYLIVNNQTCHVSIPCKHRRKNMADLMFPKKSSKLKALGNIDISKLQSEANQASSTQNTIVAEKRF